MTIPFGKVAWELCKDYLYIQNQLQLANEATIGKRNIYLRDEDLELANLLPDWQQLRFQKKECVAVWVTAIISVTLKVPMMGCDCIVSQSNSQLHVFHLFHLAKRSPPSLSPSPTSALITAKVLRWQMNMQKRGSYCCCIAASRFFERTVTPDSFIAPWNINNPSWDCHCSRKFSSGRSMIGVNLGPKPLQPCDLAQQRSRTEHSSLLSLVQWLNLLGHLHRSPKL